MVLGRSIIQFSWIVEDLEKAAQRWHATCGVGPFLVNRHIAITDPRHRGRPQVTDFSTAIAQAGLVQIELVQQHDDSPSAYRDTVPAGREALHHIAVLTEDFDATVACYAAKGYEVASDGIFGAVRFCYIDTSAALGHMVEVLEDKPMIQRFFGAIRRAAEKWDGNSETLLRELG
ncbi:MAG: VOC family protein [Sandarakinorhabdus sp.]|nr:VOC family protein [Sandarakinorhabdus sp.]